MLKNIIGTALVAVVLPLAGIACGASDAPDTVTVANGDAVPNVERPTRLDITFPGSDGIERAHFEAACDDMGGALVWRGAAGGMFVCENVDY